MLEKEKKKKPSSVLSLILALSLGYTTHALFPCPPLILFSPLHTISPFQDCISYALNHPTILNSSLSVLASPPPLEVPEFPQRPT